MSLILPAVVPMLLSPAQQLPVLVWSNSSSSPTSTRDFSKQKTEEIYVKKDKFMLFSSLNPCLGFLLHVKYGAKDMWKVVLHVSLRSHQATPPHTLTHPHVQLEHSDLRPQFSCHLLGEPFMATPSTWLLVYALAPLHSLPNDSEQSFGSLLDAQTVIECRYSKHTHERYR